MCKLFSLFTLVFFYSISLCYSQDQGVIILQGSVIDSVTGEGIPFATIECQRNGINTMSNEGGNFIFKIPAESKMEPIYISQVGYQPLKLLVGQRGAGNIIIRLRRRPVQLSEVIVRGSGAVDIIKKAIAKIPENYPTKPYLLNGFYRMTILNENRVIGLSEAVFNIYSLDYSTANQQFKLIKSRLDKDINAFGKNNIEMGQRPRGIINADIVGRINGSEILGEKGMPDHEYTLTGIIDYEGREAYEIVFDQKDDIQRALHSGKVIIDTQTLAFLSITRCLSPRGIKYWTLNAANGREVLDQLQLTFTQLSDSTVMSYRLYGGKYYLHHYYDLSRSHLYGGTEGHTLDLNPLINETNYLVTRIDTSDVKGFKEKDLLDKNKMIEEEAGKNTEKSDRFWENYNLIEANFNIDSAARAIRDKNKR